MENQNQTTKSQRTPLFTVRINDCKVSTFTVGGHGGSGKDTSNTGVRIVHPPSGAEGRATESRSQLENKRTALRRLAATKEFTSWARLITAELTTGKSIDDLVDEDMHVKNLKIEYRDNNGKWQEETSPGSGGNESRKTAGNR